MENKEDLLKVTDLLGMLMDKITALDNKINQSQELFLKTNKKLEEKNGKQ